MDVEVFLPFLADFLVGDFLLYILEICLELRLEFGGEFVGVVC